MPLLRKRRYWEWDIDIFNGGMHGREVGSHLKVYPSIMHSVCPRIFFQDFGRTKRSPRLLWPWVHSEQMMVAFKPGCQLHAQVLPFQSFANNGRWRCKWHVDEDKGVDDFLHDIEDNDNGYEDEAIICCRHSYKCMYIYYIQWTQLYMQNPIFIIFTVKFYSYKQYTNLMKVCSCIIAYVYSQWWYCADRSYTFLKHGRSQVKKVLCFYIWYDHHVGFTSRGGSPH